LRGIILPCKGGVNCTFISLYFFVILNLFQDPFLRTLSA
jgi:hypothetical protein